MEWLERMPAKETTVSASVKAKALLSSGLLAIALGRFDQALASSGESLAICRRLGDRHNAAWALWISGAAFHLSGDSQRAAEVLEQSLETSRKTRDKLCTAESLRLLAWVLCQLGNGGRGMMLFDEGLTLFRELEDKRGVCITLLNQGMGMLYQEDYAAAAVMLRESLSLEQEMQEPWAIAWNLELLAAVEAFLENAPEKAARLLGAAEVLREAISAPVPPSHRPLYDKTVDALRLRLGHGTLATSWKRGRLLSLTQAVDYALR